MRQATRDALEDVVGRQVGGVFDAGLDEELEVAVAGLERGDRGRFGGGRGGGRRGAARRRRCRPGAQERLEVGAAKAAMTAGAAIAGDLAGVAPAAQRVDADAEKLGGRAEPQPASVGRRR